MFREIGSGSVATISCSVVGRGVEVGSGVDMGGRGSGSGSSIFPGLKVVVWLGLLL